MSSIQMLLALGAMILLTITIQNVNNKTLYTEDTMYNSNFGITATSLASSIIEDAGKKRFDNVFYSGDSIVTNVGDFTPANALHVESGEDIANPLTFNDFDDYNGYAATDNTMPSAIFQVSCNVCYIDRAYPDVALNTQSWHKKITVKVWSNSMKDTIAMSSIFSYWTN
jgi:hypothetical protein